VLPTASLACDDQPPRDDINRFATTWPLAAP